MKNNGSIRLVSDETPSREREQSAARLQLAELQDQRALSERKIKEAKAAYDRLTGVIEIAVKTHTALSEFDTKSAEEAAAWARAHLKKELPSVDTVARQKLLTDHAHAQENAGAALTARKQFEDVMHAEGVAIAALKVPMQHAVAEILIEEATGAALEELRQAVIAAVEKQTRVKSCLEALAEIAHNGDPEAMRPVFVRLEAFAETLRVAAAPPAPDSGPHRAAWLRMAANLLTNPDETLET